MSLVRVGPDSDLYIYEHVHGYWICHALDHAHRTATPGEMIAHVREHTRNGDAVPGYVIPRLRSASR